MKIFSLLIISATLLCPALGKAQTVYPVKWTWKALPLSKDEYNLVFTAQIDKGWHTYSQFIGEGGPVATSLVFNAQNKDIQLVGKATEKGSKVHNAFDPVFEMQLKYFDTDLVIEQRIKLLADTRLTGTLEFMACDDARCLPPNLIPFSFDLKK